MSITREELFEELKTPEGREAIREVVLYLFRFDEPVKEQAAEAVYQAAPQVLAREALQLEAPIFSISGS